METKKTHGSLCRKAQWKSDTSNNHAQKKRWLYAHAHQSVIFISDLCNVVVPFKFSSSLHRTIAPFSPHMVTAHPPFLALGEVKKYCGWEKPVVTSDTSYNSSSYWKTQSASTYEGFVRVFTWLWWLCFFRCLPACVTQRRRQRRRKGERDGWRAENGRNAESKRGCKLMWQLEHQCMFACSCVCSPPCRISSAGSVPRGDSRVCQND